MKGSPEAALIQVLLVSGTLPADGMPLPLTRRAVRHGPIGSSVVRLAQPCITAKEACSATLDKVDKRPQWGGHQASSGVVEERSREGLPPRLEDRFERAAVEMRAQPVLEQTNDAGTGNRRIDHKINRSADAYQERPRGIDPYHLAVALEFPWRHRPAGEAAAQAGMLEKLPRVLG